MHSILTAVPALKAAGIIGIWDTDVAAGRSVLDEGAAAMLAGNPSLAGQPIPLDVALGCTHPDDRGWVFERIRRVRRTGGAFSAEFRILTATGEIRWVLNRGVLKPDATGVMRGLGAYIDTTDNHASVFVSAASADEPGNDYLEVAADRCLEAHAALKSGGDRYLRLRAELLLTGIGQALARRIGQG